MIVRHTFCNPQVDDDAPPEVIKMAYRALAKSCHPDFLGQKGHNVCILLNEVRLCKWRIDLSGGVSGDACTSPFVDITLADLQILFLCRRMQS